MDTRFVVWFCLLAIVAGKNSPWYRPCWIFACGMDSTFPVCGWDPQHGPRLFRNACRLYRHNYCYDRNYSIINKILTVDENIKLCNDQIRERKEQEARQVKQRLPKKDNVLYL